ncbi:uncharacterized protein LOC125046567 [Penaeus chinensis]|uniref:uncharacterized protein LOC125046567 n=1 Tax=Penaeus chinensis TaxID=139456 RepID=UPI001FB740D5|nr:uncharacterized protein LOC125046567 [Penaeus chinensis]
MLQKWQSANPANSTNTNCPETLYLYSYMAPDFILKRRNFNLTCTQAIVTTIPMFLNEKGCKNKTRIAVGFSEVKDLFKKEACEGYFLMKKNKIPAYHLNSTLPNKELNCSGVSVSGNAG